MREFPRIHCKMDIARIVYIVTDHRVPFTNMGQL